jgi:hypothetical protein
VIYQIPLPNPMPVNLTLQAELDQVTFTLTFYWNDRDNGFYLTIADAQNSPILASQRVVVNYWIGWRQRYNGAMPAGLLQFQDTSGQGIDPQSTSDLGTRVILTYYDLAEVISQVNGGPSNVSG